MRMSVARLFFTSLALAFSMVLSVIAADVNYDELLENANELRSSAPQKFNKLIDLLDREGDQLSDEQKNYLLYLKGYQSSYQGDFSAALDFYIQAYNRTRTAAIKFRVGFSLVNIFAFNRQWEEGFRYLNESYALIDQIDERNLRHQGLVTAFIFYNRIGLYEQSVKLYEKLIEEEAEGRNLCLAMGLNIEATYFLNKLDVNDENIDIALKECGQLDELAMVSTIVSTVVYRMIDQKDYEAAIKLSLEQIQNIEKTGYVLVILTTYRNLALSYLGQKNYPKAKFYALKVLNNEQPLRFLSLKVDSYEALKEIEEISGNYTSALNNSLKLLEIEKAYIKEVNSKNTASLVAQKSAQLMNEKIEILAKENKFLGLENSLAEQKSENFLRIIIALSMIFLFLLYWAFQFKLSHKKLKLLAEYDMLTEVCNRAFFTQCFEKLVNHATKTNEVMAFIMFDLDKFKLINDTYGHHVGDWVLKAVCSVSKSEIRQHDVIGRFGGEEFVIVLPGCNSFKGVQLAETLRRKIEEIDTSDSGHEFKITASFGVTDTDASGFSSKSLIANVDRVLYEAKDSGRNKVVEG